MPEFQRLAVADEAVLLHGPQQVRDALYHILPPAVCRDAQPQPGQLPGQQGQLRLQLCGVGAQLRVAGHAVHLGQRSLLIGLEQPPCLVVRFRFLAPPFLAEQHLQAGGIAVPAGRLLRLGRLQVGRAPHYARDALRALRGPLRRSAGKALTLAVPHQQRADVLAAGPLAVFVVGAGAAGADKAAVFPQPDLGLVQAPPAAAHVGAQVAHAVPSHFAIQILYPVRVGLGPREYRAAQQVADLFHVHPGSPSLCNALLVKHTAPAGGMQGVPEKKFRKAQKRLIRERMKRFCTLGILEHSARIAVYRPSGGWFRAAQAFCLSSCAFCHAFSTSILLTVLSG